MRELTAREIGQWLATRARFLPSAAELPVLWEHFAGPEAHAFNRLDAPTPGSPPSCSAPTSRPPSRCGWAAS